MRTLGFGSVMVLAALVAGCSPIEHRTEMLNPVSSEEMVAAPGANIIALKSTKSLPNAFGAADIYGRRTDTGRTFINYAGSHEGKAVFVRQDHIIDSNATTMSETPSIIPQVSTSYGSGYVGNTYYSGSAQTTNYQYVPARGSEKNIYTQPPVTIELAEGETYSIEGKTLKVIKVEGNSIRYTLQ